MIVRIATEGQYRLDSNSLDMLNSLDNEIVEAIAREDQGRYATLLKDMLALVRDHGPLVEFNFDRGVWRSGVGSGSGVGIDGGVGLGFGVGLGDRRRRLRAIIRIGAARRQDDGAGNCQGAEGQAQAWKEVHAISLH